MSYPTVLPVGLFNSQTWNRTNYADTDPIISTGLACTNFYTNLSTIGSLATACLSDPIGTEVLSASILGMGAYPPQINPTGFMYDSCGYIA